MDKGYCFGPAKVMECLRPAGVKVFYHHSAGSEIEACSRLGVEEAGWALPQVTTGVGFVDTGAHESWQLGEDWESLGDV